jgi:hypothetical protein
VGIGRNSAEFRSIPEFRTEIRSCPDEITFQHNITNVGEEDGVIPISGSGIETNSRSSGIGGNRKDFRGIPFSSGIPRFPEFRTEIRSCPDEITYQHNITNVGEEDGVIPASDSGIETNSRNSGIGGNRKEFRNRWESEGIPESMGIETNSRNSGIGGNRKEFRNRWESEGIPRNSVQFRNSAIPRNSGIGRNRKEFRGIPFNSGIPRFPEFRTEIRSCPDEITYQHNITNVGEEDGVIPVSGSGIETNSRSSGIGGNRKDFRGIPFNSAITGIPESMGIGRNSAEFRN